jgi:hypothetical protein
MERDQIAERYADVLAAETTVEAFYFEEALYYRYEGLNEVEMLPEIIYYRQAAEQGAQSEIVPLGKYYKAQKGGEKLK